MIGSFTLVTAPAAEPITTAEAKEQVRQDGTDEDTYIDTLIVAARRWVERTSGRALINQTWDYSLDRFPQSAFIEIPKFPLSSVTSITYYDDDLSTSTVFASSKYQVDTARTPGRIALKDGETWPVDSLRLSSGVVIRFVAGYGAAGSSVPEDLRHVIKLLVAQMYTHREPEVTGTIVSRVQFAVDSLMSDYRIPVGGY